MTITSNYSDCNKGNLIIQPNHSNFGPGNIIPHWWYRAIIAAGNKPDFVAITVLSELWFLYRKTSKIEAAKSYLKLSKQHKQHRFANKAAFIGYITKVLRYEKRDAVKIGSESFKLNCNLADDARIREQYLAAIENSRDISELWQLKLKAPSEFFKDWIQDNYGRLIEKVCRNDKYKVALV